MAVPSRCWLVRTLSTQYIYIADVMALEEAALEVPHDKLFMLPVHACFRGDATPHNVYTHPT
jgi:hypothetical protein